MARLFVFGIGGTGARVMKSFTMLLASGMKPGNYDIVPILIDPHKDLKELNDTKSLFRLYSELNEKIYSNSSNISEGFFNTKLITLKSLSPETGLKDDFEFDERYDDSFRNFLELSNLPKNNPTHELMSLLFSERNLNNSLSKGFKGNPNVGSIVLNSIKESQGFKAFESSFGNDDKIFIISSIFGGTGAAGFPLLLKNFRNHDKINIKESQIGALTVMPYFKLSDSNSSDIDSNGFMTKTKSALTYYIRPEFSNQYNAIYYIADPDKQNRPYENNEEEQNNKAHIIELLGAYSIFNFAETTFTNTGNVFEYCLETDNSTIVNLTNLGKKTREQLGKPLINFYIFSKIHKRNLNNNDLPYNKVAFNKEYEKERSFFDELIKFIDIYYTKWIYELSENERTFKPINFNIKDKFHELVTGYEINESILEGIISERYDISQIQLEIEKEFSKRELKKLNEQKILQYFISCYKSINKINSRIKY